MLATVLIKTHSLAVTLSLLGMVIRGLWMLRDSPMLRARWVRIAPHVVDTVLLLTALGAAWLLFWSHGQHPVFLTVKVIGLIAYIGLGLVALRLGKTRGVRLVAWLAAITLMLYLMGVGFSMNPLFFLGSGA